MFSSNDPLSPGRVRTMQVITLALVVGLVSFLGVVLFIVYGPGNQPPEQPGNQLPIISIIAGVFFVVTGTASFLVPSLVTQANLRSLAQSTSDAARPLLELKQTTLIMGLALLEGPAFFGLIAFLVERQALVLIVPGLCLIAMLARFPTENNVRNWLDLHFRRIEELRHDMPNVG